MHTEIEDFWRKRGKIIQMYDFTTHKFWYVYSNPDYYDQGGPSPPLIRDMLCRESKLVKSDKVYYFECITYSEKVMLKMIKMMAFI
jgi:hypothetical protein